MLANVPRLLVASTASNTGKTTVTCGLLRALQRRGLCVRACKCGPDYLDPQFHRTVLGVPSRNLDPFLAGTDLVCELVVRGGEGADIMLVEGAMGYYDGIAQGTDSSAYDVACITHTPVILVVDARGRSLSAAAEVAGFTKFRDPSHIAGVLFNRVSPGYYPQLKVMVERECDIPVLGFVPSLDEVQLEHRHLGLVAADEVADLNGKVDVLAAAMEKTVDVEGLLAIARNAALLRYEPQALPAPCDYQPLVAVARDEAFSFYYEETFELLERLGARLEFFSPLRDSALPAGACGLYLGGGYPELHAPELSRNVSMRTQVRDAVLAGMPTIAECGGFLYLHAELKDADGASWPMANVVDARAWPQDRLGRFGYVTLTARCDGLLADAGQSLRAHEFHYWESEAPGSAFCAQKPQSGRSWDCVTSTPMLHAGFPHMYLAGNPEAAGRFVNACARYGAYGAGLEAC